MIRNGEIMVLDQRGINMKLCPSCDLERCESLFIVTSNYCKKCRNEYRDGNLVEKIMLKKLRLTNRYMIVHSTGFDQNMAGMRQ